jgi:hypothetical protein
MFVLDCTVNLPVCFIATRFQTSHLAQSYGFDVAISQAQSVATNPHAVDSHLQSAKAGKLQNFVKLLHMLLN